MDSSFKISHNFPDTLDSYKPPVNSENLYNHGVAENAMMTSDHSNITSSYLFIDDNEAPRAVVEDLDMNENSFLHISKNDIGDYENANVLQKYRSIDEDKSINSSVYSMNHSSNLIHHSKSFGQGQFPDWDNQRTMPSKGQSTFIIRDPNYLDGSDFSTYINRSCSDEVVTTVASAGLNCPGADPVARSYQASRLTSQFASLQSGASSLEKTSTTSEGCLSSIEITQLSDDILSRIFSFCSWRDLLTVVSLVCKRWAFIIESDPYLCRFQNVQIDISSSNLDHQRTFISKRNCLRTVSLRFKNDFEYASTYKLVLEDFLTLLGKQCRYLETLIIKEYDWRLMSQPIPWIRCELFQNLCRLHLENISFHNYRETSFQSVSFLSNLQFLVLIEQAKLTNENKDEVGAQKVSTYKGFFEALEVLIRELVNLKEITVKANSDGGVTESILKNFVRNVIESGNPVERVDVNNIDKWVLTVPGCEMMQMVTHLKHLSVHTLSNRTDIRVLDNLLNLFNRVKSLQISIDDSLVYNARLNLEQQTFPNVETLHFSASGSTLSLVKCFPKVRHLKCLPYLGNSRLMKSLASNQDSRVILKHIHKALIQFNVAFFSELETVQLSRTYLLLYRYCERVHPRYMHRLRSMVFINDVIYFTFVAFSSHLRLPDGPELLSALRRRFTNTNFSIQTPPMTRQCSSSND